MRLLGDGSQPKESAKSMSTSMSRILLELLILPHSWRGENHTSGSVAPDQGTCLSIEPVDFVVIGAGVDGACGICRFSVNSAVICPSRVKAPDQRSRLGIKSIHLVGI